MGLQNCSAKAMFGEKNDHVWTRPDHKKLFTNKPDTKSGDLILFRCKVQKFNVNAWSKAIAVGFIYP